MLKKVINIIKHALLLVVALQVLNLSVDSIDFQPMHTTNIHEFNDLNTLTEYLAEVVLGNKNVFPESLEKDQPASQLLKHFSVKLFNPTAFVTLESQTDHQIPFIVYYKEDDILLYASEIIPPPPKA